MIASARTIESQWQHAGRTLVAAAAMAVTYYLGVRVGFAFTLAPNAVSLLWPTNALVLAALLLSPRRTWPWLIAALLPAHLYAQLSAEVPVAMVLCWYVSNMTEAVLGAWLIQTVLGRIPQFGVVRDVAVFLLMGVFAAPVSTSFLDAAFVAWIGWRYDGDYWNVWQMRLFSNALATIILVPPIVIAGRARWSVVQRSLQRRGVEALVLMALLAVTSWFVFHRQYSPGEVLPFAYAPIPLLVWAAVRLGVGGVASCIGIMALISIAGELRGLGPFVRAGPEHAVLSLQIFLIISASSLMLLAAALAELKEARRTALRRKQSLDLALDAANLGVWEWNLAVDSIAWRLTPRAAATTMTRMELLQLVHAEDRAGMAEAMRRARESEELCEFECRFRRGNDVIWMTMKGKALTGGGAIRRIIGVCMNTTTLRQQVERERAQREQLTYLSRVAMLGELSGALAHELSQPLSAILLNAQVAQQEIEKPEPDKRELQSILEDIVADDTRAGEVIRRLRALFLRGAVQTERVDVHDCIRAVLALEHSAVIARQVAIELDLTEPGPYVNADPVQLQQVLLNLIANACEAMAAAPKENRRLYIRSGLEANAVVISVRDTGPGIDDPTKIFEPFYSTKSQSLGLGLAISRTIVASHGGKLSAANHPRGGAIFQVALPLAREPR